jgi:hypothetical protein
MAAARNYLDALDFNPNQTITIDSTCTPTPQGCIVSAPAFSNAIVTFANTAPFQISISFSPGTQSIFPNPLVIAANSNSPTYTVAGGTNLGLNYSITGNGIATGPFALQLGVGPMAVQITGSGSTLSYTPNPVAVPQGNAANGMGTLAISAPSTTLPINWTSTDPFNPPINSADGNSHPLAGGSNAGSYIYNAGPSPADAPGPGKVIIRSS